MNRNFLEQFLVKISNFPQWVKEIIYNRLKNEMYEKNKLSIDIFMEYKPILTFKGKNEIDLKKSGFDNNIYNILDASEKDCKISEITLDTFLSLEETARYFLFCVEEGYFEKPENSKIMDIASVLSGKLRTGEYFCKIEAISEQQLQDAISEAKRQNSDKKFGQILTSLGLISEKQLNNFLSLKKEAKKRFVLDHNQVPEISQTYSEQNEELLKQIEELKTENKILKRKLEQLLLMVKRNDK